LNTSSNNKEIDFQKILDEEMVRVHFQPIFSIHERKAVAFEGFLAASILNPGNSSRPWYS